jgi:hypothetical protein
MTSALAFYGAVVATAALTLELVSEWRSWSTRVEVQVSRMILAQPDRPHEPVVLFRLINHSAHPVKVTHLGMEPLRKGGTTSLFSAAAPTRTARSIRDSAARFDHLHQPPESLADGDPEHKTRAIVATSDDKRFKSKRVRLRDLLEG